MKTKTFARKLLANCAKQRPRGYLRELMKAKVGEDRESITFATDHPAYVAMLNKHGRRYDLKELGLVPKTPSRGLGDTIAKITSAVGIKPCGGCKRRQATLNRLVPYHPR